MPDKNITFEIREYLGVVSVHDSGWSKELNIISWNGQAPKYDLRDWDPHHERMSRGITLHPAEMRKLVDLYIASNNKKTIEEGKSEEEKRRQRQAEFRKTYAEKKQDSKQEEAERDAMEGAQPPEEESAESSTEITVQAEPTLAEPFTGEQRETQQETTESF